MVMMPSCLAAQNDTSAGAPTPPIPPAPLAPIEPSVQQDGDNELAGPPDNLVEPAEIADPMVDSNPGQFQIGVEGAPGANVGSNFFGEDEDFDKGVVVRSGDVAFKLGGYLKVDFIQDFNPITNTDAFDVTTIEVGATPRTNTRFHARQTRLNGDLRWLTENHGPIRVFVEGDFFFNQRESNELGEDRFRLRHAYAQHTNLIVGQTWTTLSDIAASPATLDFEGQVASVTTRRTQIRWTRQIPRTNWSFALALEDPIANIEPPDGVVGKARTQTPDAVARLRLTRPRTQFQVAGVVRQLGFQVEGEPILERTAWGLNFTDVTEIGPQSKFYFEILYGSGIGSFRGLLDAGPTVGGDAKIIGMLGWMVGGTHNWSQKLSSNVTFAENGTTNYDDGFPDELDNVTYMAANLIYTPTANTNVGIEYLYGLRENIDGQSAQANRVQVAFTYFLP